MSNYVCVQDAVSQRIIKWKPHPHLLQLIKLVQGWTDSPIPRQPLYIVIFKSRQVYTTTTTAGIINWLCTFFESTKVLESSQREDDANEILAKSRFINENHPDFLRLKAEPDQASLMGFPATHSRIRALPATAGAGRSTDATLVFTDEWERHEYAEKNFGASKPTIDKGGIFIGATTIDKTNMNSFPQKVYHQAKAGENNFVPIFWDYFVVPERTEETYQRDTKDLDDWQREAEYPRSEEEAFAAPKDICRFNVDALTAMMDECISPLRVEYNGWVKIYRESVAGRNYCFPIDPSEGSYDPSLGVIIDSQTHEEVAKYAGKIPIDEQARIAFDLYTRYNNAFIAPERNASGLTLIDKLKDMGVANWHYYDKARQKQGWWTSSATRPVMIQDLAENIRLRQYRIADPEEVKEFQSFIRTDKYPDGKARGGCHDEAPMVWAIYSQIRKRAPLGEMRVSSFTYS